jgi:hypothetical protein
VLALLNGDGEEARVVGGAVRNALLKIPTGDIDIATTALPDEVIRRAKAAGIKSVPTGIDHGTVTLVVDAQPFEVTTLREDTETFGRKAKVAFGRDWVRDAERRDFTINGLSVDAEASCTITSADLTISPQARALHRRSRPRIAEDYLRILRFFRIHAAYGAASPIAPAISPASRAAPALRPVRRARAHGDAEADGRGGRAGAVTAMADGGLLLPIFGGVAYTGPFAAMIAAERMLGWSRRVARLGALAVAVTEDAKRVARAASDQCRNQGAGFHGPSLVAARRHGRGDLRAEAQSLSARRRTLYRTPAFLLPVARQPGGGYVIRHCAAATCGRWRAAEIPLKRPNIHRARRLPKARCSAVLRAVPKTRGLRRFSPRPSAHKKPSPTRPCAFLTRDNSA